MLDSNLAGLGANAGFNHIIVGSSIRRPVPGDGHGTELS